MMSEAAASEKRKPSTVVAPAAKDENDDDKSSSSSQPPAKKMRLATVAAKSNSEEGAVADDNDDATNDKKSNTATTEKYNTMLEEIKKGNKKPFYDFVQTICSRLKESPNFLREEGITDIFIVYAAVMCDGSQLANAPKHLKDNKTIVKAALQQNGRSLKFASRRWRGDKEMVKLSMHKEGYPLLIASKKLRDDKELVIMALKRSYFSLEHASDRLRDDIEVVEVAVDYDPEYFCFASDAIKKNTDCVLRLVAKNDYVVKYVGRDLLLALVQVKGDCLACADDAYKSDPEIALAAIKQGPHCWHCVGDDLKADREFVLTGLRNAPPGRNFYILLHRVLRPESSFWPDPEVTQCVLEREDFSLRHVYQRLKSDYGFVLAAVQLHDGRMRASAALSDFDEDYHVGKPELSFAPEGLRSNSEIVLAAVQTCGSALEFASEALRANHEIVLAAVQTCGAVLEFASEALRDNFDIVLAALKNNGQAVKYASDRLKGTREIAMAVVQSPGGSLAHVLPGQQEDSGIVVAAIQSPGFHISELPAIWVPRLLAVVSGVKEQIEKDQGGVVGTFGGTVRLLNEKNHADNVLSYRILMKKWMVQQKLTSGVADMILDYAGIEEEIGLALELIRLAPIFVALASHHGISWTALPAILPRRMHDDE